MKRRVLALLVLLSIIGLTLLPLLSRADEKVQVWLVAMQAPRLSGLSMEASGYVRWVQGDIDIEATISSFDRMYGARSTDTFSYGDYLGNGIMSHKGEISFCNGKVLLSAGVTLDPIATTIFVTLAGRRSCANA